MLENLLRITGDGRRDTLPKYPVVYERKTVYVELDSPPKKGRCEACGRVCGKGIKITALHHHCYKYSKKRVIREPQLSLENTSEVCFSCHRVANSLMNLLSVKANNIKVIINVAKLMPEDMKEKLDKLAEAWREYRRGTE